MGKNMKFDIILIYFDEYNMVDGYYFTNIWTQFEHGFVAMAMASNFVTAHASDSESRTVSLFLVWGAGYPNTS